VEVDEAQQLQCMLAVIDSVLNEVPRLPGTLVVALKVRTFTESSLNVH
jgi:hypothetical protein